MHRYSWSFPTKLLLSRTSITIICWSGRPDSNRRSTDPKSGGLNQTLLRPEVKTRLFHPLKVMNCCMRLQNEQAMSWNRVYQQLSSSAAIHASHQHRLATSMSSSSERGFIYLIHRLVYRYDISSLSGMLPYESGQTHKITWHEQCSNDLHTFTIELSPALSLLYINLIQRPLHLFRKVVLSSLPVFW